MRIRITGIPPALTLALLFAVLALNPGILQPARSQTFTTNSPMSVARWSHGATLLPNGLVLISGGTTANEYPDNPSRATNQCELYHPATGTFTPTGFLTSPRSGHIAVLLTNGLVLVAGGRTDFGNILSLTELYQPDTGVWTNSGSLKQRRSNFAAALLPDGRVLAVGGFSDNGEQSSAELYDPASGSWTSTAPVDYAADSLTATVLPDGRVLVCGGSNNGTLTNASLFNPASGTWTPTGSLKTARSGHAATLLPNGKVLVVGGSYDNSAELYDPATGQWTYTGSMSEGRGYPSLTLMPDGRVLVIGGFPGQTGTEFYDPGTGAWTAGATLHVGRIFHTATLLSQGQVLVTGGDSGVIGFYNGPALADVETYNLASTELSIDPTAGTEPRLGVQSAGNQILLIILNRPPGALLESAVDLSLPAPWQEIIPLANGQTTVTLEPTGAMRYFRLHVPAGFNLAKVAPPLDASTFVDVATAAEFIYAGTNGIQTSVTAGALQAARASVLRGRVVQRDGTALAGVRVTLPGHPELGRTFSRDDGRYDLAVNGGFQLLVNFDKTGFLPAQRPAMVGEQTYAILEDVALIQLDPAVTEVALGDASPGAIVRGSQQTDSDGSRTAVLLVPPGLHGSLLMPDGSTRPVGSLHIRATEFTVGSNGPAAMPAALPATSGYTYAVELSADEAAATGARGVTFDQDIPLYVDNFIGFPVGMQVPTAYYDRERAAWVPIPDGRVVRVTGVAANLAELDTDGDGQPDTDHGASLGITAEERGRLATLYTAGQTLWRVPVRHFTPYDLNHGISPAPGATYPGQPDPKVADPKVEDPSKVPGYGTVAVENQVLTESLRLAGTPFTLEYSSDEAAGDAATYQMKIQLSGSTVPAPLKGIRLTIEVAGRSFVEDFPPDPNQSYLFIWDGLDAYGRSVPGRQLVTGHIDYLYTGYYNYPPAEIISFALASGAMIGPPIAARDDVKLAQPFSAKLGSLSRRSRGLGGWGLSAQHIYDPEARVLYLGTGGRRSAQSVNLMVKRVAGVLRQFAPLGDGGPATEAFLSYPYASAFGPDGSLYIAEGGTYRVRRVTPDGIITTAAGNGFSGFFGDGGPAVNASLEFVTAVAVGPDGSLYISESGERDRVRKVDPHGIITTVAGGGPLVADNGPHGDGGPAVQAGIISGSLAVAPDGTLYIDGAAYSYGNKIRRVGPDGIISTVVGKGPPGFSGDDGPATEALIGSNGAIALGPDGSLYVADGFNHRVRRVTPDGIIKTIIGGGDLPTGSDGVPGTAFNPGVIHALAVAPDATIYFSSAVLSGFQYIYRVGPDGIAHLHAGVPHAYGMGDLLADNVPGRQAEFDAREVTVGPDGAIYLCDNEGFHQVRRIAPPLPGFDGGEILIPSTDASEIYVFDKNGRHLRTVHALTGATLIAFQYDAAGRLASVQDGNGLVTTFEHDLAGNPTGVLAPFGQHTGLTTSADGFLASVANPAGETTHLAYSGPGLLSSVTGPKGENYSFSYDSAGYLLSASDPAGGSTTLVRGATADGYEVQATTALGRVSHHLVETLANGVQRRLISYPDGTTLESLAGNNDGIQTTTYPSGVVVSTAQGPDPRFGMQSPIPKQVTISTPGGLTNTTTTSRSVTLQDPDNTLSVTSLQDTVVIDGRTNTLVYSASNRTFVATSAEGRSGTNQIDALGRVVFSQTAGLNPVSFLYDPLGRLTNTVSGSGPDVRSTRFGFDGQGWLQYSTNALGEVAGLGYNAVGRVTQQTLPGGRTVGIEYDANGRTTAITPPGRPAHHLSNNLINLLSGYTPPVINGVPDTEGYQYNADRDLTGVTRPDNKGFSLTYDPAGHVTAIAYPLGETLNFTYDPTTAEATTIGSSDGSSLALTHDGALLTSMTWSGVVTGRVSFLYNQELRVATQLVNSAAPIQFLNDQDNLLTNAGALSLAYQPQNQLLSATVLGSVADTRSYNAFGELTRYAANFAGGPLYTYSLQVDALGRITNQTETIGGQTTVHAYSYDEAGHLGEVRSNGALATTYAYDPNGNRRQRTRATETVNYTYDDRDRLQQRVVGPEVTVFSFTRNGTLKFESNEAANINYTYTYDARGNLVRAVLPAGTQITYVVDGGGRRIGKLVNGGLVKGFLYQDALNPIAELDAGNQVVSRFVYGSRVNVPEYMIRDGMTYRILCDHLGSPRLVVNAADGSIAQRMDYDEFGVVLADSNPGFQPFGFAGGIYDSDTHLLRFGARDYDAATGQWTCRDPILFEGQQTSLYAYVGNDPVNQVDPLGTGPTREDKINAYLDALYGRPAASAIRLFAIQPYLCPAGAGEMLVGGRVKLAAADYAGVKFGLEKAAVHAGLKGLGVALVAPTAIATELFGDADAHVPADAPPSTPHRIYRMRDFENNNGSLSAGEDLNPPADPSLSDPGAIGDVRF